MRFHFSASSDALPGICLTTATSWVARILKALARICLGSPLVLFVSSCKVGWMLVPDSPHEATAVLPAFKQENTQRAGARLRKANRESTSGSCHC